MNRTPKFRHGDRCIVVPADGDDSLAVAWRDRKVTIDAPLHSFSSPIYRVYDEAGHVATLREQDLHLITSSPLRSHNER